MLQRFVLLTPDQVTELADNAARTAVESFLQNWQLPIAEPNNQLPDLLTRQQAASLLQVSLVTLYDWSKDTDDRPAILTPQKIGTRVRYQKDEVLKALKTVRKYSRK